MRRLLVMIALTVCLGTSSFATSTIEFSPDSTFGGNWTYDGAGTLSFDQIIAVDKAMSSNVDALVGSLVYIPTLTVSGIPAGPYTVTPLGDSSISIKNSDGSATYLTGFLNPGDLVTVGTIGALYTQFHADIYNVVVTGAGEALGSAALDAIIKSGTTTLDFELSLQGGSGTNYHTLTEMLAGGYTGGNGFSGAITVPEPVTLSLFGLGSLVLLRRRTG